MFGVSIHTHTHTHTWQPYICICICICTYIYITHIYIYSERARERKLVRFQFNLTGNHIYIYTHTHIYTYVYIYIYKETPKTQKNLVRFKVSFTDNHRSIQALYLQTPRVQPVSFFHYCEIFFFAAASLSPLKNPVFDVFDSDKQGCSLCRTHTQNEKTCFRHFDFLQRQTSLQTPSAPSAAHTQDQTQCCVRIYVHTYVCVTYVHTHC